MGRAFESRPAHHDNRFSMATPASSARESFSTTKSGKIFEAIALVFIVTLGSGLRFWHLGARSLWVDEGATAVIARLDWWNFLRLLWRREANMSFYYLLMRGWIHLGHGEAWLRALAATFGVLAVPAIYFLGRTLWGRSAGLVAALLLALNAFHIRYSQEARSYSLAVLLVILSVYFLAQLIQQPSRQGHWKYCAASTLAVYSHFYAALVLLAQGVAVLKLVKLSDESRKELRRAMRVIALALIPVAVFLVATGAGPLAWLPRPSWGDIHEFAIYLSGAGGDVLLGLYLLALLLATIAWRESRHESTSWRYPLIFTWLVLPMIIVFGLSLMKPIFMNRFLIVALPALCLLAAAGITQIRSKFVGAALAAGLAIGAAYGVSEFQRQGLDQPDEEWRAATHYLLSEAKPQDGALFYSSQCRMPYEFYRAEEKQIGPQVVFPAHGSQVTFRDFMGRPEAASLAGMGTRYPRVWLVMCHNRLPTGYDAATQATRTALSANYKLSGEQNFSGIEIELYQR